MRARLGTLMRARLTTMAQRRQLSASPRETLALSPVCERPRSAEASRGRFPTHQLTNSRVSESPLDPERVREIRPQPATIEREERVEHDDRVARRGELHAERAVHDVVARARDVRRVQRATEGRLPRDDTR